ncbi:MAG TPA: PadR family transcriptional regulator [Actinotalea sp.]|nr:PadR family transcriptional regulator [Actinotalea sp.]
MARARGDVLELAILGLLQDTPMHGYELRKRLNLMLGSFRALSYGSLYPALRTLAEQGLITAATTAAPPPHALAGKRARNVYELTADGKERLAEALGASGPTTWDDEQFDVRFSLFAKTDVETRLRILEGRRTRLSERLDQLRTSAARTRERVDEYTLELQRHGLEQAEREIAWLDGLITREREPDRAYRRRRPAASQPGGELPAGGSEER